MKKILITGGAGFIGSNASNIFSENGYKVIALDTLELGTTKNLNSKVSFIKGDVKRTEDLERVGPVNYIIHLAGSSSAPMFNSSLTENVANNIVGHTRVLEFASKYNVEKILFASTSSIYGNNLLPLTEDQSVTPLNFYAVTKHCQEQLSAVYHRLYGIECIGFRFMSVYGLNEEHKGRFANLISQFIWGIEQGKRPVIYGDGTQTRDFTNVRDIVKAFKLALETKKCFGFDVFNVGTAKETVVGDLVPIINKIMGTSIGSLYIENPIAKNYIASQLADLTKIERELGYKATVNLEDGIREIVRHRKNNPIPPASMSY